MITGIEVRHCEAPINSIGTLRNSLESEGSPPPLRLRCKGGVEAGMHEHIAVKHEHQLRTGHEERPTAEAVNREQH